jgi:CPA1 family monovalent cation:H+ antiporter
LVFILNGLLFILVGVQLRSVWADLQDYSLGEVFIAGAVISLTVIALRVVWVALTAVVARRMGPSAGKPGARAVGRDESIIGWAGLRGGDTLAAALSVPYVVASGDPFPARAEIVFLAFVVIFVTLVGQGLTLPILIRRLGVGGDQDEAREEALARQTATQAALDRLHELARDPDARADLIRLYRDRYERELAALRGASVPADGGAGSGSDGRLYRAILQSQREALLELRDEGVISDEVMREVERDLDLEEARLAP